MDSLESNASTSRGRRKSSLSAVLAATVSRRGRADTGGGVGSASFIALRDGEITRLRRSYARAELSRGEMRRCLRALAVQLRSVPKFSKQCGSARSG